MKNRWQKLGLIYCPSGNTEWMQSHASVPIAEHVQGNIFRIYFSTRNKAGQSSTGYVLIDLLSPKHILEISDKPVIAPGDLGEFDDSGAMATWLVSINGIRYLYYIGWNLGVTVPFRNSIGLAISKTESDFKKYAPGPIVDRTTFEPHFVASCCVLPDLDKWRMWYLSCTDWQLLADKPRHRYHIKYAESIDGMSWQRNGIVAVDFRNPTEYAISRPSVIKDRNCWKMWFSCRGTSYRIGYAESEDGVKWIRKDSHCKIDVSVSGWDSDMIEYPFVFDHQGARYMIYNGNGFGKTGFGLAVME